MPASVVRLDLAPPVPVRHLAALVRDVGAPSPAADRAVELLYPWMERNPGRRSDGRQRGAGSRIVRMPNTGAISRPSAAWKRTVMRCLPSTRLALP